MSEITLHGVETTGPALVQPSSRRGALKYVLAASAGLLGLVSRTADAKAATALPLLLGTASKATAATTITTTIGTGVSATGPSGISGTTTGTTAAGIGVSGKAGTTAYGVMSNGKLGATGPLELGVITVTSYVAPAVGKAFLYSQTNAKVTELRLKLPSGKDVLIAAG
ncbi:MAG: hypothetical protein WCK58_00620 [Chloroflexota bacterium]